MTTTDTRVIHFDNATNLDSTSLEKVWYDSVDEVLVVQFRNGNRAGYAGVPPETYQGLVTTNSAGRFYNWYVKGQYRGINTDADLVLRETEVKEEAPVSFPEAKDVTTAERVSLVETGSAEGPLNYEVTLLVNGESVLDALSVLPEGWVDAVVSVREV